MLKVIERWINNSVCIFLKFMELKISLGVGERIKVEICIEYSYINF